MFVKEEIKLNRSNIEQEIKLNNQIEQEIELKETKVKKLNKWTIEQMNNWTGRVCKGNQNEIKMKSKWNQNEHAFLVFI